MPTKLDLPASDRRVKVQLNASEKRAKELRSAHFDCCTFSDGTACTGAGKVVTNEDGMRIVCANHCMALAGRQQPTLMTAEEAATCKKKRHHKTPYG